MKSYQRVGWSWEHRNLKNSERSKYLELNDLINPTGGGRNSSKKTLRSRLSVFSPRTLELGVRYFGYLCYRHRDHIVSHVLVSYRTTNPQTRLSVDFSLDDDGQYLFPGTSMIPQVHHYGFVIQHVEFITTLLSHLLVLRRVRRRDLKTIVHKTYVGTETPTTRKVRSSVVGQTRLLHVHWVFNLEISINFYNYIFEINVHLGKRNSVKYSLT